MTAVLPLSPLSVEATSSWDHCRNSLGIARLLVHEGRPLALVATACRMALENGCRAALEQAGVPFEGDLETSLRRLSLKGVRVEAAGTTGIQNLAATERALFQIATYLRSIAPGRSWGV